MFSKTIYTWLYFTRICCNTNFSTYISKERLKKLTILWGKLWHYIPAKIRLLLFIFISHFIYLFCPRFDIEVSQYNIVVPQSNIGVEFHNATLKFYNARLDFRNTSCFYKRNTCYAFPAVSNSTCFIFSDAHESFTFQREFGRKLNMAASECLRARNTVRSIR